MASQPIPVSEPLEGFAVARYVRLSPQKARLVIDLIRGEGAERALTVLGTTRKGAARHIAKVLRSAIANVQRKAEDAGSPLDVDRLFVIRCAVNPGPVLKRFRGAPFGRAHGYVHRTSHIIVAVAEQAGSAARRAEEPTTTRGRVRKAIESARQGQRAQARRKKAPKESKKWEKAK
ncbi:MAG TPA: 50S ribosomal protein L22 [Patescibacteria group bacterium]|nr:50S ribosomal protein L22 [Patescibacteria group bacterium]